MNFRERLSRFIRGKSEETDLFLEGVADDIGSVVVLRADALEIPTVYACTELIADTIASLNIKLYHAIDGHADEVSGDVRVALLNDDTKNLMSGIDLKKAMVRDLLLDGAAYVYVNKSGNNVRSLHYIEPRNVGAMPNADIIFKDIALQVGERQFQAYDFIIPTKNTLNGVQGTGILADCNAILKQSLDNMRYTTATMGNGGVKRGVLQSTRRLTADAITELKKAWKRLYSGNNDCIVLNEGITYHELQQTGAEMQMVESKKALDEDICKIFNVPPMLFDNTVPDEVWEQFVRMAIIPLIAKIESAVNKTLLLEHEKEGCFYFAFDTKQLNKGDIEKRFKAYEIALKNGFMTPSEVRYEEDLNEIETLNFVKFSLGDVLMNVETGEIYTPNTDTTVQSDDTGQPVKGGDENEDGIKE